MVEFRIEEVIFSPDVVEKLWTQHRLTQWEVEQVIFDSETQIGWDEDPAHGAG